MKKPVDKDDLLRREALLKELAWAKKYRALDFFEPFEKQKEFLLASSTFNQIFFMAANRIGKSFTGARAVAYHLTGLYPDWWTGRRFTRPVTVWATNKDAGSLRDVTQWHLIGNWLDVAARGSGAIPKECIDWKNDVRMNRFQTDLISSVMVQHVTDGRPDGKSELMFKGYNQGREAWQGKAVDVIWMDEEPADDLYGEAMARLVPTRKADKVGLMMITATPLIAGSQIREKFLHDPSPSQCVVHMAISEAGHIGEHAMEEIKNIYPEREWPARLSGIPMDAGSMVFSVPEKDISCEPFQIPQHWYRLWGIDFGIFHPFAAVLIAWDKDADCIYVTNCIRLKDALPIQHAAAMKPLGAAVPVAWPQDGTQRKEFEGDLAPTAKIYKAHGLHMQDHFACFPDKSYSTEAGLTEMRERMASGRFKVFRNLVDWFGEYRAYHYDNDGKLVKLRDDLMSATRVAVMAKRGARLPTPGYDQYGRPSSGGIARGANPDPYGF